MKIHYHSDLHLDVGFKIPTLPGGDVLVLAGDIAEAKEFKLLTLERFYEIEHLPATKLTNKERINRFFIGECARKYEHVILIAGNHEHYNGTFNKTIAHIKSNVPDNFHVLDKESVTIDNVLFIGGTMWTDMNRGCPMTRQAVKYGMNDYTRIRREVHGNYIKFSPADSEAEHHKTIRYIKTMLDDPASISKQIVVVTHHAPTGQSISPEYRYDYYMNGGYCSRLDDFILDNPRIKFWIHGHTHTKFDYEVGDYTRVVCNPFGYQTSRFCEETGWDQNACIEI